MEVHFERQSIGVCVCVVGFQPPRLQFSPLITALKTPADIPPPFCVFTAPVPYKAEQRSDGLQPTSHGLQPK